MDCFPRYPLILEILVLRSAIRQKQINIAGTILPAFPDLLRLLRPAAAGWRPSGEKDCSRRLCFCTGDFCVLRTIILDLFYYAYKFQTR